MAGSNARPRRICQEDRHVSTLTQHRHVWANDTDLGILEPVWPTEPDIEVARKIAISCLPPDLFTSAEIRPFAETSLHRLYCISSTCTTTEYLIRVALPIDPFFKTESEVATMEYVRKHTTIPVPHVIAYASSASNELGFEWILMERIESVTLEHAWSLMTFEQKEDFTLTFGHYMNELQQLKFPRFRNIYFADIWNQVCATPLWPEKLWPEDASLPSCEALGGEFGDNGSFVLGRIVSFAFCRGIRLLLPANRGPFDTTHQLLQAECELLGRDIRRLSPKPGSLYYCEADKYLADDGPEVLEIFDKLQNVISTKLPSANGPEDTKVLWHDDLSDRNILVDPKTYKLVGIIDWECVSVVPVFSTAWNPNCMVAMSTVPEFLRRPEVGEPDTPAPPREDETDEEWEEQEDYRYDWDLTHLRRKYAEIIRPYYGASLASSSTVNLKSNIDGALEEFEERWDHMRSWLNRVLEGEKGSEESSDEDNQSQCSDSEVRVIILPS